MVWADKRVDFNAVTRLEQWAGEIGIRDVVQAEAQPFLPLPLPGRGHELLSPGAFHFFGDSLPWVGFQ